MKFILDNWYLILIALVSGSMLFYPMLKGAGAGSLSTAQAIQHLPAPSPSRTRRKRPGAIQPPGTP